MAWSGSRRIPHPNGSKALALSGQPSQPTRGSRTDRQSTGVDDHSQLLEWLKEKQSEGNADSEGSFTLTQDLAWDKLAAFQLPFTEAWAVKLVQAAVALKAQEIAVYQTWQATSVVMRGVCGLRHEELVEAVLGWNRTPPPGLEHLSTAVRVLAKGVKRPFMLDYGEGVAQVWTGSRFAERKVSARKDQSLNFTVYHFSFDTHSWQVSSDTMKATIVSLSDALVKHCYPCPVPLKLDGRAINGIHGDPEFGVSQTSRTLGALAVSNPDLPRIDFPWGTRYKRCQQSDLQIELTTPGLANGSTSFGALAVFTAKLLTDLHGRATSELVASPVRGQIVWVRDGAVVQREELDIAGRVTLSLVLGAEGLETDLTGFQLRKTEQYQARKALALELLKPGIERFLQALPGTVKLRSEHPLEFFKLVFWRLTESLFGWQLEQAQQRRAKVQEEKLEAAVAELCERVLSHQAETVS